MGPDHGLSDQHVETVRQVLRPFSHMIDSVALFGSRALGTARPTSDIDLVLFGPISEAAIDRIRTEFIDSALPMSVDVVAYDAVTYPPFREHIDRVARPLFSKRDLMPDIDTGRAHDRSGTG